MKVSDEIEIIIKNLVPMGEESWKYFGYDTKEPCCVCGTTEDCKSEPRFGYSVCRKHANIKPIETNLFRT